MDKKTNAYLQMTAAMVLVVIFIILADVVLFPDRPALGIVLVVAVTLLLHLPQLPRALKAGRAKGISDSRITVMTMVFGFTWWKNIERGIIRK